ncbi:MAG: scaffolding protein [Syntrophomonadaceae bacterium]|nr:scaffolding protein [Syntrophomonadaceae bacterium]
MSLLKELLGDLYTEEIAKKIGDKELAVINDGSYVPRQKLNEKEQEAKDLRKQLDDRDKQLDDLKTKAAGNEDLQKQIQTLKDENQNTKQEFEGKMAEQRLNSAIELAIHQAGAKNVKAVRALLNSDNIKVDGDKLFGFDDQIKGLRESDAYLFGEGAPTTVGGGTNPAGGGGGKPSTVGMNDFIRTMAGR